MFDKKVNNRSSEQEIAGRVPVSESGSSGEIQKPVEQRPGNKDIASKIQARLEDIEGGKAPAVDQAIMEAAKKAAAAENGGSNSRENLQHFLDVLHDGSVNDPASIVDEVLAASSGEEIRD